jgi:hypothetical protein
MSAIIFLISSFLGSKPSARIATFSSLASMVPARPNSGGVAGGERLPLRAHGPQRPQQRGATRRGSVRISGETAARVRLRSRRGLLGGAAQNAGRITRPVRHRARARQPPCAPEPSVSNRSKASRISCFCSSVSSGLPPLPLPRPDAGAARAPGAIFPARRNGARDAPQPSGVVAGGEEEKRRRVP